MLLKPAMFLASALVVAGLIGSPIAAQAGGMSHMGSYGGTPGHGGVPKAPDCGGSVHPGHPGGLGNITINKPVSINNNITVYKPVTVTNNIDNSKNIEIYKPVTINKSIDNSKNININKNIDINKTIIINKGGGSHSGSQADASANAAAEATAVAEAVAAATASSNSSSNAVINFNGGNGSSASSSAANASASSSAFGYSGAGNVIGGGSFIGETPGPFAGGDLGNITVEAAPVRAQCSFQDATVIKAIHAVCISADHHEFPASHMIPDTWIDASYEGEVARCIAGAHLKVTVGAVFQSNQGMASSWSHGQVLECADHEAVRHFKDGMLKCAPAEKVVDCTERTNLRKYGTGDMFFTYRTQVCLETHEEYSEMMSRQENQTKDHVAGGYQRSGYSNPQQ